MSARAATDQTVGAVSALGGGAGFTLQWLTDFSSLVLIGLNVALAVGGLALVWRRNRIAKLQEEALERERDGRD